LSNTALDDVEKITSARETRSMICARLEKVQRLPEPTGRPYYKKIEIARQQEEVKNLKKIKEGLDYRVSADFALESLQKSAHEVKEKNEVIAMHEILFEQTQQNLPKHAQLGPRGFGLELELSPEEYETLKNVFDEFSYLESFCKLKPPIGPCPTPFWEGLIQLLQRVADHRFFGETADSAGGRKDEIRRLLTCKVCEQGESDSVSILFDTLSDRTVTVKTAIYHLKFNFQPLRNRSASIELAWLGAKFDKVRKKMMPLHLEHWHRKTNDNFAWAVGSCTKLGPIKLWAGQSNYVPFCSSTFFEITPDWMDAETAFELLIQMDCADDNIEVFICINQNHDLTIQHKARVSQDRDGDVNISQWGWQQAQILAKLLLDRKQKKADLEKTSMANAASSASAPPRTPELKPLKRKGPVGYLDRSPQKADWLGPPWVIQKLQGEWKNDFGMTICVDDDRVVMSSYGRDDYNCQLIEGIANILLYVDTDCYFLSKMSASVTWLLRNDPDKAVHWFKPDENKPSLIKKRKARKPKAQKPTKPRKPKAPKKTKPRKSRAQKRTKSRRSAAPFSPTRKNQESDEEYIPPDR